MSDPYPAVWFIIVFLLTTISVIYSILTLVKLEKPAAIAGKLESSNVLPAFTSEVELNTNFVKAGLGLNLAAWTLALVAILMHRYQVRKGLEVLVITISFVSLAVGSILLTIAATKIDLKIARITYVFAISAGSFGLIAALFQLINWFYVGRMWLMSSTTKSIKSRTPPRK